MKRLMKNSSFLLMFLVISWIGGNAQTNLESEVPGDNFSLEGALELFKKSASPEEFEKMLNSPDSKVNNLDLNNDGNIDYVRVIDRNEGNVHAFIIQAILSETESQDVAVIELQKLDDGKATLQITGDADVYGTETIIEPTEEVRVNAGASTARVIVNVWAWPSVQYIYSPYYSAWASPWGWAYSPIWWRPWRPVAYYVYAPWWRPYRPYYSLCYTHRIGYLPRLYHPYRTTSVVVYNNYHHQIDHFRSNHGGRNRYDGGSNGGRDRYTGYGNRSRNDYNGYSHDRGGRRYDGSNNVTHKRSGSGATHGYDRQRNGVNSGGSRSSTERNFDRSNTESRNSFGRTHSNSGTAFNQRSDAPERRSSNRFQQSSPSMNMGGGSRQHSPQRSFSGPSQRTMPFNGGGGSRGTTHGGGGGSSFGGHQNGGAHGHQRGR